PCVTYHSWSDKSAADTPRSMISSASSRRRSIELLCRTRLRRRAGRRSRPIRLGGQVLRVPERAERWFRYRRVVGQTAVEQRKDRHIWRLLRRLHADDAGGAS